MKVNHLNRREVLTLLGGAAAWPVAARAQQTAMPVIGFLNAQSAARFTPLVDGFRRGLGEVGYVESQNVAIEYRWAKGQNDRLPALADDLVRRRVAVIVAAGGAHFAAKAATTTIPLVVSTGGDPIKQGLIASLNRPGGNLTGATVFNAILEAKRFELLHALVPNAGLIGALLDLWFSITQDQREELEKVARALAQRLRVLPASTEADPDDALS